MKRTFIRAALVAVALCASTSVPSRAASQGKAQAVASSPLSQANPYRAGAKQAYEAAVKAHKSLVEAARLAPGNFGRLIAAYYAYTRAQARYTAVLDAARKWERPAEQAITGRVLVLDGDLPLPGPRVSQPDRSRSGPEWIELSQVLPSRVLRQGKPVEGAHVLLSPGDSFETVGDTLRRVWPFEATSMSVSSDRQGRFRFGRVVPGNYGLIASRDGLSAWYGSVDVPKRGDGIRDIYLSTRRTLFGTVSRLLTGTTGTQAAPGARVMLCSAGHQLPGFYDLPDPLATASRAQSSTAGAGSGGAASCMAAPPVLRATADARGAFSFAGLDVGRHWMRVELAGYAPFFAVISVGDVRQRQDVILIPRVTPPVPPGKALSKNRLGLPAGAPETENLDRPLGPAGPRGWAAQFAP
ncbi:MAG: carboxypeptidase regulatory-like domain-containing protein [Candidatus Riflebacteria bacterium]|nr:carboxypeptidase regulatory-like domain-containing protein [Candidatus Riflebacteria bacterium]